MSENHQGWQDQAKGPGPRGEVQTLKDSPHPQSQSQRGKSPSRCRDLGEVGGIGHEESRANAGKIPKLREGTERNALAASLLQASRLHH